jgi:Cu-processing system permease protein
VDLCRVLLIMQLDVSALMGYTGAVFQTFFDRHAGLGVAGLVLLIWVAAPLVIAFKLFKTKDL